MPVILLRAGAGILALAILAGPFGCGGDPSGGGGPQTAPLPGGTVRGAYAPIPNADVRAFRAGTNGQQGVYGTGASQLAATTSNSSGNFSFNGFSCNKGDLVYYVSSNENKGANPDAVLVTLLGRCGDSSGALAFPAPPGNGAVINEVTTVGAAYTVGQFAAFDTSLQGGNGGNYDIGTSGLVNPVTGVQGGIQGLTNGFIEFHDLIAQDTGLVSQPHNGAFPPQANIYALADSLSACVESTTNLCAELFSCAMPGAAGSVPPCTGGKGTMPPDTFAATLNIARNPSSVAVSAIFNAAPLQPFFVQFFSPALSAPPPDWTMPVSYDPNTLDGKGWISGSFLAAVTADGSVVFSGPDSFSTVTVSSSGVQPSALSRGMIHTGIAIDRNAQTLSATVNSTGTYIISGASSGSIPNSGSSEVLSGVVGLAFDQSNPQNLFIASNGNSKIAVSVGESGSNIVDTGGVQPEFMAVNNIPRMHAVYVTDDSGDGAAGQLTTLTINPDLTLSNPQHLSTNMNHPRGIAVDLFGQGWVANNGNNIVQQFIYPSSGPNAGVPQAGVSFPTGAGPTGIAVDGAGKVFVANNAANSITETDEFGSVIGTFTPSVPNVPAGSPLLNELSGPNYIAIDLSGNLWVPNTTGHTYTELLGIAVPVETPINPITQGCPP